jgi:uncharacterized protein (UPF0262 family)
MEEFDAKKAVKKEIKELNNFTDSIYSFKFKGYDSVKIPVFALLNTNRFNPEEFKGQPFKRTKIKADELFIRQFSVNDVDGLLHAVYIINQTDVKKYIRDFLSEVDEPDEHVYGVLKSMICWLDYFDLKDPQVYDDVIYSIVENSTKENTYNLMMKLYVLYDSDINNEYLKEIIESVP